MIEGVSKSFGPKVVLDRADLLIEKGETLVVIGRSGQGKSVLLKNIVRLLEPDEGMIWIEGEEITSMRRQRPDATCGGSSGSCSRARPSSIP